MNASKLPCYGVFSDLVYDEISDEVERFRTWLLLHATVLGERVVEKLVRERGTPEINAPLEFVAVGELI
jgi:hypothetical protein